MAFGLRHEAESTPRILVTDAQDRAALAAVRCLREARYQVTAAADCRWAPTLWSLGWSAVTVLPDPSARVDAFIDRLEEFLRKNPHDVLLALRDETLYAISGRRQRIEPHVALCLPSHEVVKRALDKVCLATEAAKVGLSTPEGQVCTNLEEALRTAQTFGFPVLVKGVRTIVEVDGRLVRYPSRLVPNEGALRATQPLFGTCIVQRREQGNVMSFAGVATDRGLLGSVVSRYRRTWPPNAGMASFLETIRPPSSLTERVQALVAGIGWSGVFQLQLIECDHGAIKAIDFNPRLYGSMSVARAAGAPLATLWCGWVLGEDPKPAMARAGVGYRWEEGDVLHIGWQLRNGDFRGAAAAAFPRRGVTHAYFRARDPLPTVALAIELGRRLLARARTSAR